MQKRYEEAEEQLLGSLEIAWDAGDLGGVAGDLEWLGQVAVAKGRAERGVILAGAASQLRESLGVRITALDYPPNFWWQPELPRDAARRVLTEREIDTAWAQGRVMPLEEALVYARDVSTASTEAT